MAHHTGKSKCSLNEAVSESLELFNANAKIRCCTLFLTIGLGLNNVLDKVFCTNPHNQ